MIDESVLEELLGQIADEIAIPGDGPDRVLDALTVASKPKADRRARFQRPLLATAAAALIALVAVPLLFSSSNTGTKSASTPLLAPRSQKAALATPPGLGAGSGLPVHGATSSAAAPTGSSNGTAAPAGPVDSAKIVKTGTLDLQVPHAALHSSVNRVTAIATGFGGYVATSQTSFGGASATAQITIRVPVADFETAVAHLEAMPGVTVLSDSENGADVTGQYVDLQAQLAAATGERDALLALLSHAQSIGDIIAVHDRLAAAQTDVDQLQGRINQLDAQASFSSIALSMAEKSVVKPKAVVHRTAAESGLAKSWSDARRGFADVIEWLIARSGGALIVLLAALALLFGVRYLYPIVRRGLV